MIAALVPAAGRSTRMGRPKLVLPIGGRAVIARLVHALRVGGAEPVVVVTPPRDEPGAAALVAEAAGAGATVLPCPSPTADMRATVEIGIDALARCARPPLALLLAPGDSPGITPDLVARIIESFRADPSRIVVPRVGPRRGHPVAIPWELAALIPALPPGIGVNALLAEHADRVATLEMDDPGAVADLDTPEDYQRWSAGPTG